MPSYLIQTLIMEESKSLSSFQIAGLVIQNHVRSLLQTLKSYQKRSALKSLHLWKYKALSIPRQTQSKIKYSLQFFNDRFRKFLKTLQFRVRGHLQDSLIRIIFRSKAIQIESKLHKSEEILKNQFSNDIQGLTKDIKNLQEHQEELEKNWKKMKNREDSYKNQIQDISGKKNEILKNRKRIIRDREEELSERIEELKDENSDIREKIAMIENNVASFIGEMGGLLEFPDLEKASDKRRASVKKNKSGKKARIPLFTIDVSKN